MVRFLTGVTMRATVVVSIVGVALLAVAWPIAEQAIWWIVPEGMSLTVMSPSDPGIHKAVALLAFALPPALGWIVAAARGARRGTPSGYGVVAACTGIVLAIGAARALLQMSSLRAMWREASEIIPMVDLGSLDHWGSAIIAMAVTAAVMLVVVMRYPGERRPAP